MMRGRCEGYSAYDRNLVTVPPQLLALFESISLQQRAPDHEKMAPVNRASSTLTLAASLALFTACHKSTTDPARATASVDSPALLAPEMSADASLWVNGAPSPLAPARGSVVLIEGWNRL
jgi:hypothetical protein